MEKMEAALLLAGILALVTILITLLTIRQQLLYNTHRRMRSSVVRILLMAPLYAASSCLGIAYPGFAPVWDVLREVYEAIVIYSLFQLMMTFLGGEHRLRVILANRPPDKVPQHLFPCCCLSPWTTVIPNTAGSIQAVTGHSLQSVTATVVAATHPLHHNREVEPENLSPDPAGEDESIVEQKAPYSSDDLEEIHDMETGDVRRASSNRNRYGYGLVPTSAAAESPRASRVRSDSVSQDRPSLGHHTRQSSRYRDQLSYRPPRIQRRFFQLRRPPGVGSWSNSSSRRRGSAHDPHHIHEIGNDFVLNTQLGIFQYAIIRPLTALLAFIFHMVGIYGQGQFTLDRAYIYVSSVYNMSQMWAMYCLVLFYHALGPELAPIKPLAKFLSVKFVVFFTFWQGLLIAILVQMEIIGPIGDRDADHVGHSLQNLLIGVEMVAAAIIHIWAFDPKDVRNPRQDNRAAAPLFRTLWDAANLSDVYLDDVKTVGKRLNPIARRRRRRQQMLKGQNSNSRAPESETLLESDARTASNSNSSSADGIPGSADEEQLGLERVLSSRRSPVKVELEMIGYSRETIPELSGAVDNLCTRIEEDDENEHHNNEPQPISLSSSVDPSHGILQLPGDLLGHASPAPGGILGGLLSPLFRSRLQSRQHQPLQAQRDQSGDDGDDVEFEDEAEFPSSGFEPGFADLADAL